MDDQNNLLEPGKDPGDPEEEASRDELEEDRQEAELEFTKLSWIEQQEFSFHAMACAWDELLDAKLEMIETKYEFEKQKAELILSGELTGTVAQQAAQLVQKMDQQSLNMVKAAKRLEVAKTELAQAKLQNHFWQDSFFLRQGGKPASFTEDDDEPMAAEEY